MFGDSLPPVYIKSMDYGPPLGYQSPAKQDSMQCVYVGLAAIAVVYMLTRPQYGPYVPRVQTVSSMLATAATGISARLTGSAEVDASQKFEGVPPGIAKLIDGGDKETNYKTLKQLLAKHNRIVVVVFAHWCPHCKTVIAEMGEKAEQLKATTATYVLVNGEAVDPKAWRGEDKICDLKYFPTILAQRGAERRECASLEEATAAATQEEDGEAPAEAEAEEENEADVFARLF